jgi:DNA-binding SARP family transcriptional activator
VDLRILGTVSVSKDGEEVPLEGAKQRTVLAALLLAQRRVISDAQLSRLLWNWDQPATASAQIYTYVSRLRRALHPQVEILRRRPGYLLTVHDGRFDYEEFDLLSRLGELEAAGGRHEAAARYFQSALGLWRGPALADVTEHLASSMAPVLDEARMAVREAFFAAQLALDRNVQVATELTGLVAEYPLRESLRAMLMTALYRTHRRADALTVYQQGRKILADELGVDPGPVLARTYQAVLTGDLAPTGLPVPGGTPVEDGRRARLRDVPRGVRETILAILVDARLVDSAAANRAPTGPARSDNLELLVTTDRSVPRIQLAG